MARTDVRGERPILSLAVGLVALAWFGITIHSSLTEQNKLLRQIVAAQSQTAAALAAAASGGGGGSGGAAAQQHVKVQAQQQQQQQHAAPKSVRPIRHIPHREMLPALLQEEGLTTGAELGVLIGEYAHRMLTEWTKNTKYYLVDLWKNQENYVDLANADSAAQEQRFEETKQRLQPWKDKTVFLRMYTTEAAKQVPDNSLDFVYVDARHDYCGVMDDLMAWWPKLRSGGIFAGHDYIDANHQLLKDTNQDWSVCGNGTINMGAVKGAVDEFAAAHGLTISTTEDAWPTWMARVP